MYVKLRKQNLPYLRLVRATNTVTDSRLFLNEKNRILSRVGEYGISHLSQANNVWQMLLPVYFITVIVVGASPLFPSKCRTAFSYARIHGTKTTQILELHKTSVRTMNITEGEEQLMLQHELLLQGKAEDKHSAKQRVVNEF